MDGEPCCGAGADLFFSEQKQKLRVDPALAPAEKVKNGKSTLNLANLKQHFFVLSFCDLLLFLTSVGKTNFHYVEALRRQAYIK